MMRKTLIGALLFSMGLSCQIQIAMAAPAVIVGEFSPSVNACDFDNLGKTRDTFCSDTEAGFQCSSTPAGAILGAVLLKLVTASGCTVSQDNFHQDPINGKITFCIPDTELKACMDRDAITTFYATLRIGGETRSLSDLELRDLSR